MEINGVAHVFLTVSDLSRSRTFYARLLPFLGMQPVMDSPEIFYCVGGRTGLGLRSCTAEFRGEAFNQHRVGLHHLCLRARSREDVDSAYELLLAMNARILRPPREDQWAPGYYSILFEDPDGIRLEINFVPGRGLLER
jgi:catechol 2,3-dioxygenase-like lactoylglutathione lyase family enzyme